jgi:hypothetical protein
LALTMRVGRLLTRAIANAFSTSTRSSVLPVHLPHHVSVGFEQYFLSTTRQSLEGSILPLCVQYCQRYYSSDSKAIALQRLNAAAARRKRSNSRLDQSGSRKGESDVISPPPAGSESDVTPPPPAASTSDTIVPQSGPASQEMVGKQCCTLPLSAYATHYPLVPIPRV